MDPYGDTILAQVDIEDTENEDEESSESEETDLDAENDARDVEKQLGEGFKPDPVVKKHYPTLHDVAHK